MALATGFAHAYTFRKSLRAASVPLALLAANPAHAQDLPDRLGPLQTASDLNGVNILTGKTTMAGPVLLVPAAPNLKFDNAPSAAPYLLSKTYEGEPDQRVETITVNTADGGSDSFSCVGVGAVCESVTGNGSTIGAGRTQYRRGNSGELYVFSIPHVVQTSGSYPRTKQYYLSAINYPSGETISYQYGTATLTGDPFNRLFYRPVKLTSSLGYHITLAYQGSDFNGDPGAWQAVAEAGLYKSSDPATPIARLTYGANGSITDLAGRVYQCAGCSLSLGNKVETASGSLTLPGDSTPTIQYVPLANNANLVGTVIKDGVAWSYSYQNVRSSGTGWWYDSVTVAGPNGYNRLYALTVETKQNVLTSVTENVSGVAQTTRYVGGIRPAKVMMPEQNAMQVVYDALGNITERRMIAKPALPQADIVETASYPAAPCTGPTCFRPIWVRDARGAQTDYLYNTAGYVTERTDPADAVGVRRKTYVTYDSNAGLNRKTVVRQCGTGAACGGTGELRTEWDYWQATFLPSVMRQIDGASGAVRVTAYGYDAAGRLVSVDGPVPGTADTSYNRYDIIGRKVWEIAPAGTGGHRLATRYTYRDADDKVTAVETGAVLDPANPVFVVSSTRVDATYDTRRNAVREAISAGGTTYALTQRSFDDRGQVECAAVRMNPAAYGSLPASACTLGVSGSFGPDRITRTVYDAAGQVLRVQQGYGTALQQDEATYGYSGNGKRTSLVDANGNRAQMVYDGFDRQVRWSFPSKTSVGAVSGDDYEEYGYDANGNRTSVRKRDGQVIGYGYDALNRVTFKDIPPDTIADVYYSYDLRGLQLSALYGAQGRGDVSVYDGFGQRVSLTDGQFRTLTYQWDLAGNRTRITHPDGVYFSYDHDALNRVTAIRENGGTVIASYAYDALGRRSGDVRGVVGTSYGYDAMSRLSSLGHDLAGTASDVTATFGYDPAGDIVTRTRDNDGYAFNGYQTVTRGYAANGLNQYTGAGAATFTYDSKGNLTGDGTTTFTYDRENRLRSATGSINLSYSPNGQLNQVQGPAGGVQFLNDGDEMVAEHQSGTNALLRRYVHGPSADDPVIWYEGPGLMDRRSLQIDAQGSVVSVADAAGNALGVNGYDDHGIPNGLLAGRTPNLGRFQYTGQTWIPELGMYHYKARMYSPTLGRFMQTDPIGYGDQINLYAYVANDPVNGRDPTGLAVEANTCSRVGGSSCSGSYAGDGITASANAAPPGPKQGNAGRGGDGRPLNSNDNGDPSLESAAADGIEAAAKRGLTAILGRVGGALTLLFSASPTASDDMLPPLISPENLNASQARNLGRFEKSVSGSTGTFIYRLPNGSVQFSGRVNGNVPGSYATYVKVVDSAGKTQTFYKETIGPRGEFIHRKVKFP